MAYEIVFAPAALEDLKVIFTYVADAAGIDTAAAHDAEIRASCLSLADFPRRGSPRDDVRPGLRSIPSARTVTLFYAVSAKKVHIARIVHARRDTAAAFEDK